MERWGPAGFSKKNRTINLEDAVKSLTPKAKQAMYAAAKLGPIAQGTWNGCAFNVGGKEIGQGVSSYAAAAEAFEMPAQDVKNFIRIWDGLKVRNPTKILMKTIEKVGFLTVPHVNKSGSFVGTYTTIIHESEASFRDEFDKMVEDLKDLDNSDLSATPAAAEFREATEEAARTLFA